MIIQLRELYFLIFFKAFNFIPVEIGDLLSLKILMLNNNNFSGYIPKNSEIGNLNQLTTLELSYNNLNGSIPSELSNLGNLVRLELQDNNFTVVVQYRLNLEI